MKTSKSILIIMLIAACFTSRATITIFTGPITDPANGYTYYLLSPDTWSNSEAFAQTLGGNLATVNSAAENQWISTTFFPYISSVSPAVALWIGYYDPSQDTGGGTHASNFVWVSGEPVTYTDWYPGEPDNLGGIEFYTAVRGPANGLPYTWNDLPNNGGGNAGITYGVVEVVPEPSNYALASMGVLGLWTYLKSRKPLSL
jgi:lectin-like protein